MSSSKMNIDGIKKTTIFFSYFDPEMSFFLTLFVVFRLSFCNVAVFREIFYR